MALNRPRQYPASFQQIQAAQGFWEPTLGIRVSLFSWLCLPVPVPLGEDQEESNDRDGGSGVRGHSHDGAAEDGVVAFDTVQTRCKPATKNSM